MQLTQHYLEIYNATWQTIVLVVLSSGFSIIFGLFLGIILHICSLSKAKAYTIVHHLLNTTINILRSIPFIVLFILLLPITRFLVGSAIGVNAAVIALTVAAIPFFARIVQNSLAQVDSGIVELSSTLGASKTQHIFKFLLPEAASDLISGATLTTISLVGYSAMAGVIGGGGLGQLAIDYGYERFNLPILVVATVILILIVQVLQHIGNKLTKQRHPIDAVIITAVVFAIVLLTHSITITHKQTNIIRLGSMGGIEAENLGIVKKYAWDKFKLPIEIVKFNDYSLPNRALDEGDIDANLFQHQPFLDADKKAHGYKIKSIAKTFVYPLSFYSKRINNIASLPNNGTVAIANDPTNEGRALLLLAAHGIIKVNKSKGELVTVHDITSNPKHLHFATLGAATLPRVLKDADLVAINNDFIKAVGLNPKSALLSEDASVPYVNVLVVKNKQKINKKLRELITALHSPAFIKATRQQFPGAVIGWKTN